MTERTAYLLCLAALAGLAFLAPERWTSNARLSLLGALRPVRESVVPKGSPREGGGESIEEARAERDLLRAQVNDLVAEVNRLRLGQEERRELAALPDLPRILVAEVLMGRDASPWRRSLVLARGSAEGVPVGAPVVRGRRVLGRVVEVSERTARVLLVADPTFAASAVAVPPGTPKGDSPPREEGVLRGSGEDDGVLVLKRVSRRSEVCAGWLVVTARDDASGWPAGLLLGTVKSVADDGCFYPRIEVAPAAEAEGLESVMVLAR